MESIAIRETYKGWVMTLNFSFSKEVQLKTLDEAEEVAEKFHHWVHEFGQYAVEKPDAEEKKE
jgi:hypothetical protein